MGPLDAVTTARLEDVARLCQQAQALAARGRAWFDSDEELHVPQLAADSLVLKLGEAVRRLPEEFLRERAKDPVWRRAIAMRHRIAHEYDAIDYEIVWTVIATHAGELERRVHDAIALGAPATPPEGR